MERSILLEAFLIRQISIPGNVGREPIRQEHGQLLGRHEPLAAFGAPRRGILRPRAVQAISVCPRIDGVSQDRQDSGGRRRPPLQLPDAPAALAAKSQLQVIHDQVTKDRVRGTEFLELLEDQPDHPTRLLVRLLNDLARGRLEVSQGDGQEQLAALRLVPAAAKQAIAHRNQLIFTHGAFHAKEEAVVAVQGIVDAVLIAQQGVKDTADVDEVMPFRIRPRQPAELQPQHDPHMVQAHFRHQPLESRAIVGRLAALALVLVDDHHPLRRPAEPSARTAPGHIAVRETRGSRALAAASTAAHRRSRADRGADLESSNVDHGPKVMADGVARTIRPRDRRRVHHESSSRTS